MRESAPFSVTFSRTRLRGLAPSLLLLLSGCKQAEMPPDTGSAKVEASPSTIATNASDRALPQVRSNEAPAPSSQAHTAPVEGSAELGRAELGSPAPDFTLLDLEGKPFKLSDSRGKVVVLEWFNPECPYVKAAHTKGSLINTASALGQKGVVYVAINSGAPGKQGHGKEVNLAGARTFKLTHPILLDESGKVGKAYGATNTPHLFVIDSGGKLVYRGAIDNSKDGEGQSAEGGTLINYLTSAVESTLSGRPVAVPETKAYGCSVKYGS